MSYRKKLPDSSFSIKIVNILLICIIFFGIFLLTYSMGTIIVESWFISVPFIVTCLFIIYFSYRHKRSKIFIILDNSAGSNLHLLANSLTVLFPSINLTTFN